MEGGRGGGSGGRDWWKEGVVMEGGRDGRE